MTFVPRLRMVEMELRTVAKVSAPRWSCPRSLARSTRRFQRRSSRARNCALPVFTRCALRVFARCSSRVPFPPSHPHGPFWKWRRLGRDRRHMRSDRHLRAFGSGLRGRAWANGTLNRRGRRGPSEGGPPGSDQGPGIPPERPVHLRDGHGVVPETEADRAGPADATAHPRRRPAGSRARSPRRTRPRAASAARHGTPPRRGRR